MYCEINISHRLPTDQGALVRVLQGGKLGTEIPVRDAWQRSRRYSAAPPRNSLFAHETMSRCFVICLNIYADISVYHVEGENTSLQRFLEVVETYTGQLLAALSAGYNTRGTLQGIRLFEDSGEEIGVEGILTSWRQLLRAHLSWSEAYSKSVMFLTAVVLLYFGIGDRSLLWIPLGSLALVLAVAVGDVCLKYLVGHSKIVFVFRRR